MFAQEIPMELMPALLDQLADSVLVTDSCARIVYANAAFMRSTGFDAGALHGQTPRILRSGLHSDNFYRELWQTLRRDCPFRATFANRDVNGVLFHEEKTITPIALKDGRRYYIAVSRPVFSNVENPAEINDSLREDPMTGLMTRSAFLSRLESRLRDQGHGMLAYLDLDHFDTVNQALGLEVGDLVLVQVAQRLSRIAAGRTFVGRLGGDEFAVFIDAGKTSNLRAEITELQQVFDAPFDVSGEPLFVRASIGGCLYPRDTRNASALLRHAQTACWEARENGGGQTRFFHPGLRTDHAERLRTAAALRLALHQEQFRLYFQPQVRLLDGDVVAMEALLRWQHPQRGLLEPSKFLHDLERSAVCHEAGLWVLREACRQYMNWPASRTRPERIAINLSPRQFTSATLVPDIVKILDSCGMPASALEIEITETALMREARRASRILEQLKSLGVRIAIDDFATGYSSLSYLMKFPVDALKIPIEFIAPLPQGRQAREIVKTIISLAETLRVAVVAEGVTTDEQAKFLQESGCALAQGYLYQRPAPLVTWSKQPAASD